MKTDALLSAVINFLLPVIFLYGLFFLVGFFESGFFAFIYALVLFVSGLMLFYVVNFDQQILLRVNMEYVALFVLLLLLSYVVSLLFFVTDFFTA